MSPTTMEVLTGNIEVLRAHLAAGNKIALTTLAAMTDSAVRGLVRRFPGITGACLLGRLLALNSAQLEDEYDSGPRFHRLGPPIKPGFRPTHG